MRNPNGYGTVRKLSGNRRKPYAVYITTGWEQKPDGEYKQVRRNIGYYKSRKEANIALAEYHKTPYDLDSRGKTFKDIFIAVDEEKFSKLKKPARGVYTSAFEKCKPIHDMRITDIKTSDMQKIMDTYSDKSASVIKNIALLCRAIYKYCLVNDIVGKDYSQFLEVHCDSESKPKVPFSVEEIESLWVDLTPKTALVLFAIFTGMRKSEIENLEPADFDMDTRLIRVNGTKTEAAKRVVPIHSDLVPLIEDGLEFHNFTKYFKSVCKTKGLNHTPHETRHTFVSLATQDGVNPVLLKKIVGHSTSDLTEKVYTHAFEDTLVAEIDKIETYKPTI